jgi:hypothetical protein
VLASGAAQPPPTSDVFFLRRLMLFDDARVFGGQLQFSLGNNSGLQLSPPFEFGVEFSAK